MKYSKLDFDEIFDSKHFLKKPKIVTMTSLKNMTRATKVERESRIASFCSEEELSELMCNTEELDSTILIQFALEDLNMDLEQLSKKTRLDIQRLKQLANGKILPWKLKTEELLPVITALNIPLDDYIAALRNKTITIDENDIKIKGIQLPRAKNSTRNEQKKAMIDMEKQLLIQDETEEREEFIQTLKYFVNR